jgi:hypothetical protein
MGGWLDFFEQILKRVFLRDFLGAIRISRVSREGTGLLESDS